MISEHLGCREFANKGLKINTMFSSMNPQYSKKLSKTDLLLLFFRRTAARACFVTASQGRDEKHQQWRSSDFQKAHHFHRALACTHTKDIL